MELNSSGPHSGMIINILTIIIIIMIIIVIFTIKIIIIVDDKKGIHAREWISPATVTFMMRELLTHPRMSRLTNQVILIGHDEDGDDGDDGYDEYCDVDIITMLL